MVDSSRERNRHCAGTCRCHHRCLRAAHVLRAVGEKEVFSAVSRDEYAALHSSYELKTQQSKARKGLIFVAVCTVACVYFLRRLSAAPDNRELLHGGGWLPGPSLGVPVVDLRRRLGSLL